MEKGSVLMGFLRVIIDIKCFYNYHTFIEYSYLYLYCCLRTLDCYRNELNIQLSH